MKHECTLLNMTTIHCYSALPIHSPLGLLHLLSVKQSGLPKAFLRDKSIHPMEKDTRHWHPNSLGVVDFSLTSESTTGGSWMPCLLPPQITGYIKGLQCSP